MVRGHYRNAWKEKLACQKHLRTKEVRVHKMYDVGLKRDQTANQVIGHKAELEFRVEEKGDTDSAY